jgi:hypothetical protein
MTIRKACGSGRCRENLDYDGRIRLHTAERKMEGNQCRGRETASTLNFHILMQDAI